MYFIEKNVGIRSSDNYPHILKKKMIGYLIIILNRLENFNTDVIDLNH